MSAGQTARRSWRTVVAAHRGGARRGRARWRRACPGRDRRGDGVRRRGADPAPRAAPPRADRRPGGPRAQGRPDRGTSTPTSPRATCASSTHVPDDAEAVFLALPHGAVAEPDRRVPRPRADGHRPGSGLPAPRPRRLPALVPLRASAARAASRPPSTACRSSTAPSWPALGTAPGAIVGAPGCYATTTILALAPARARRAHRGPRRRREERRVGRRAGPQGGPPLRRGQRERQGVRDLHATATSARSSRSSARSAATGREPGRARRRLPAPPHPDDPRHPVRLPRPPDPPGDPGRARRAVPRRLRRRAVHHGRATRRRPRSTSSARNEFRVCVPRRRAERPDPGHRRPRQPRQGRRRPGDPGVQRGPRPAGDRRPAPAPLAP